MPLNVIPTGSRVSLQQQKHDFKDLLDDTIVVVAPALERTKVTYEKDPDVTYKKDLDVLRW